MKDLKKIVIWHCIDGADGYGTIEWFLTEGTAENYAENSDCQLSDNIDSVETFEGSDIHKKAVSNEKEHAHEEWYNSRENYYESKNVGTRAKSNKTCVTCGKTINIGTPHEMHHFYPEFNAVPTHKECVKQFMKNLK
jgi:hypothetical protein